MEGRGVDPTGTTRGAGGVQSLDRALGLLDHVADAGGTLKLSALENLTGLPSPTVHRLVRALVRNGYLVQDTDRSYALGPRLIRMGEIAGLRLGARAENHLRSLAAVVNESANLALLEHDMIVYVAQAPATRAVRMFTEVGRRVHAHSTGVGKAVLAQLPDEQVRALLHRTGMPARTALTCTSPDTLLAELAEVRRAGCAVDDGEEEDGVRCVAVPVTGAPVPAAISVSAPAGRLPSERRGELVDDLRRVAAAIGADLTG